MCAPAYSWMISHKLFAQNLASARKPYVQIENSLFYDEIPLNPDFSYTFSRILTCPMSEALDGLADVLARSLFSSRVHQTVLPVDPSRQAYYVDIFAALLVKTYVAFQQLLAGSGFEKDVFNIAVLSFRAREQVDALGGTVVKAPQDYQIRSLEHLQSLLQVASGRVASGPFYCRVQLLYQNKNKMAFSSAASIFSLVCPHIQNAQLADQERQFQTLNYTQVSAVISSHRARSKHLNYASDFVKCVSLNLNPGDALEVATFLAPEIDENQELLLKNMAGLAHLRSKLSTGASMDYDARLEAAQRVGDVYSYQLQQIQTQLHAFRKEKHQAITQQQMDWICAVIRRAEEEKHAFKQLDVNSEIRAVELPEKAEDAFQKAVQRLDQQFAGEDFASAEKRREVAHIQQEQARFKEKQAQQRKIAAVAAQRAEIQQLTTQINQERALRVAQNAIEGVIGPKNQQNTEPSFTTKSSQQNVCERLSQTSAPGAAHLCVFDQFQLDGIVFFIQQHVFKAIAARRSEHLEMVLKAQGKLPPERLSALGVKHYRENGDLCCFECGSAIIVMRAAETGMLLRRPRK